MEAEMVSPTGAARKRLLGVALGALLALVVSAAPASAAQRQSVCLGAHGSLHVRTACRVNEHRLPLVRGRSAGSSNTITTCENKKGALRVIKNGHKCHHGETKLVWNVKGVSGPAGQPQTMKTFAASQEAQIFEKMPVTLFSAGGVTYTFADEFVLVADALSLNANGNNVSSYGLGVLGRPVAKRLAADPWSEPVVTAAGNGEKEIAKESTLGQSEGSSEQIGVWDVTVESPGYTTWIHASIDTGDSGTGTITGTALTVPN
jgi:hypothetical protein